MIDKSLMKAAIDKWGVDSQTALAQEECAELIVEIAHFKRGRSGSKEKLIEEIADVTIVAYQMAMMFGEDEVQNVINQKMERLARRLDLGIYESEQAPVATNVEIRLCLKCRQIHSPLAACAGALPLPTK